MSDWIKLENGQYMNMAHVRAVSFRITGNNHEFFDAGRRVVWVEWAVPTPEASVLSVKGDSSSIELHGFDEMRAIEAWLERETGTDV